ncbi:hypothetical protein [Franzmannia qiaohouensis]|uniref:Uncharacterized protein n=1 Tax=Franzmannia qiaohouensis TaxID=1329370 RepID=A0ABU1HIU7_9GAMM|nr:hypothetical protein [Halomonas qiaohouensis]MDR5907413.1 hypothetical protein [Halomonas qiaohouensis]
MEHLVSPHYDHSKLESPSLTDLIDVFEDSWRGYVFGPAEMLLKNAGGDAAAMTLETSYFEAIAIYMTGENSEGKSKQFFVNGFSRCFNASTEGIETAAKEIYKHIRCGLAHTGMLTHRVNFSREGAHAFYVTYPKDPDGSLNLRAPAASIVVNPQRMHEGIMRHFEQYINDLRCGRSSDLTDAFQKAISLLWGLGESENIIGMTEDKFKGRA